MSLRWQISAGEFFELLRPAAFALAALASACVLASARRRGFALYAVALWTLGTLFFPLIILPLYLIARAHARRRERTIATSNPTDEAATPEANVSCKPLKWRLALPALYALMIFSIGSLLFYLDYQSTDAHLARANQARLLNQRAKVIREYRAALRLEDNPHTHNLLGVELAADGRWEEALTEFRAAEQGGEPDEEIYLHIATALDALTRPNEATLEYQKFLNTPRCAQDNPYTQCEAARVRLQAALASSSR